MAARARRGVRRGPGGHAGGDPVPGWRLQPHLPAALPRPGRHPAPAAVGGEGEGRPRHGPRVPHPGPAPPALPVRRHDGRPLHRRVGDRLGLLRDGEGRRGHPASGPAVRPAARAGVAAVRERLRRTHRAALRRRGRVARARGARQGGRVRRPADGRLDQAVRERPHRRHRRLERRDRVARGAQAARRRAADDPQRLPLRQHGARRATTRCAWSASSTGRWPPSATR